MGRKTRQEMSGIFDRFLKKKSEQKSLFESGAMVPAPSQLPAAPKKQKQDLFAFLEPTPQLPALPKKQKKSFFSRFLPPVPTLPSEVAPKKASDIFDVIVRETKPADQPAPTPSQPMTQWAEMFSGQEEPPIGGMFEKMAPAEEPEPPPPKYVLINPSTPPEKTIVRPNWLPAPSTAPVMEWKLPSVNELAEYFQSTMNLPAIWDSIRGIRSTPEFKKDQLIYLWQGTPMMIPIDPVVYQEKYTDWGNFYGIPWGVIQMYVDVPREYQKAGDEALWNNVLSPLNATLPEAFELLKPDDIPGFFNVSFSERSKRPAKNDPEEEDPGEQPGEYWLYYVEPKLTGTTDVPPGGFGGA